ncbi:MAG TPA: BTAD domain-containing putative transcriptional regulator [Nakamurella sp.]
MIEGPELRVGVLGPLRLSVGGMPVEVRGAKRRAVLALLAIAQGRIVTVDALVDTLWPDGGPESRQALHSHVSRLRGQLGPASARLQTRPDGYRLDVAVDELDLALARSLLSAARAARDPATAFEQLTRAHELWRGEMLADLCEFLPIASAVAQWSNLNREVLDARIEAGIAAGRADEVASPAVGSLEADPLREPAVLLAMRALAATGRAAEALRRGRDFRRSLVDETGLDPSDALDRLERDIAAGAVGMAAPRTQAPVRASAPLIGRDNELAAVGRLLDTQRLITVVGPGGVGKTRLARHLAERRGGRTVLLAPVTDVAAIEHALAAALNLTVAHGDVLTACLALLGDAPGLLVVDNCEHQIDAARRLVDTILGACPRLTVLATSREPLGLADESVFRLPPLRLPAPGLVPTTVPSVTLFLERAGRVRPDLTFGADELRAVAAVVTRLDGMPLAIELAAGRLSTFSVDDLRVRLDRSLDLLGGPRPRGDDRHRTLRATVEWSYQLLGADEQRLFRHLAQFADGVDLDTAEQLARELCPDRDPGEQLARLVDSSMIDAVFEPGTRYRMLETLRAYGLDRLGATGERTSADERFLRWAVDLARWIEHGLDSADEPAADAVLRREIGNLRVAWRLARRAGPVDDAADMACAMWGAIAFRDLVEVRGWVEELVDDPALNGHPRAAAVWGVAADSAYHRGALDLAERRARAGTALGADASWQSWSAMSVVDLARGAYRQAADGSRAAARVPGGPRDDLGVAALAEAYAGRLDRARALNDGVLASAVSPSGRAWAHYVSGEIDSLEGHFSVSEEHYGRAIELARRSGATFLVGVATVGLLSVRVAAGRIREALGGYREVVDYFDRTGNWTHLWTTLRNLADLLDRLDDGGPATALWAAADRAPDAAADTRSPRVPVADVPGTISRDEALQIARDSIDRHLSRH